MRKRRTIALVLAMLMIASCAAVAAPDDPANEEDEAPPQLDIVIVEAEEIEEEAEVEPEPPPPAVTPRPTLPPEGPYAALIASLREAGTRGRIAMPRALEGWLVSRATLSSGGLEVAVPMFVEARPGALSKYDGEEPSVYMQTVVRQLADQMLLIPMDADVGRIPVSNGIEPNEALVEALIQVGEDMEQWIGDQLTNAKAYGALTRLTFDMGNMNKASWRYVRFDVKNQAPIYGTQPARRTLKEGDAGPSVRAAQEALLAQGFLDADRATGTFTPKMTEAVLLFQARNSLPETGQLTPEEQYLLLGEIPPYSLPEELGKAWNREEDFATWWPLMVPGLTDVSWSGSTVTITYKDYTPYEDHVFAFVMSVLLFDKNYSLDDLHQLMEYALVRLNTITPQPPEDGGDIVTYTISFSITLDALRSGGGLAALAYTEQEKAMELFDAFHAFAGDMAENIPGILDYVLENPEYLELFQ